MAIHGNKSQNARTKALADFKAGAVRILVATDIAARGLDIDQLPHVVNFELPNVDEDYVHRIGRTGRAGRSGEAISLVAPDEEKLLKSIERMTRQKIADGDLMGFDSSTVEAEKPEVRERPDVRNPRNPPRGPRGDGPGTPGGGGGRKDKGKEKSKEKPAAARGERPAREQKPREAQPAREQRQPAPRSDANRAPDEFRDDDVDNFGNRADYVSPYQNKNNQSRGRRPGAPAAGTGAAPAARTGGAPQGRQNGPRTGSGASTGTPPAKRSGPRSGAPRDGQARRENRPARDDARQEPAVKGPRENQPKIMHKESKSDRFPTPEQLDQLPNRPRGVKPALLTRNR